MENSTETTEKIAWCDDIPTQVLKSVPTEMIKKPKKPKKTTKPAKIAKSCNTTCPVFGEKCNFIAEGTCFHTEASIKPGNKVCPRFGEECTFLAEGACFHKARQSTKYVKPTCNKVCPQFGDRCNFLAENKCFHKSTPSEMCHYGSRCNFLPRNSDVDNMTLKEYDAFEFNMQKHFRQYNH